MRPQLRLSAGSTLRPALRRRLFGPLVLTLSLWLPGPAIAAGPPPALAWVTAGARQAAASGGFDAVVEAVRQTVVAAQVAGAVVQLAVKPGDRVAAGQLLLRLDARAAEQTAAAGDAQVLAARAALDLARQDLDRQRQLARDAFISAAALERAEAQFKATQAQVHAQLAQAGAARAQSGLSVVRAPFAGVVAEVPVSLGDMALPGRPLLTLYDPAALRVSAALPQSVAAALPAGALPRIELPGLPAGSTAPQPLRAQLLPVVDAATHTVLLRADLPGGLAGVVPGLYARIWLPLPAGTTGAPATLSVPRSAVVRRAELTALYVLDAAGAPTLRQVRLGRSEGEQVQVLAGLAAGERVATDPQAAAQALPAAR
jgi:RND family efflux transporter MFP subunit